MPKLWVMHRLAKTKLILMQRTTFPSPLAGMAAGTVISFCALSAFVPQTFSSKIKLNLTLFSLLLGGAAGLGVRFLGKGIKAVKGFGKNTISKIFPLKRGIC